MNLMFSSFEEYAAMVNIQPSHPSWEAFKIVWNMSRTPALTVDKKGKLKVKRKK